MGVHQQDPVGRNDAVIRYSRGRLRQCHDGVILVEHADRAPEPEEMDDQNRSGQRNI